VGDLAELRLDRRVNDSERRDTEHDGEPGDEIRRDEFEKRLIEPASPLLDCPVVNLVGVGSDGHSRTAGPEDQKSREPSG